MTDQTCASCDNPAPRGVTICGRCEKRTRHHLGDMEAHRTELVTTLTRQARLTAATEGSRSANTPLPYAVPASDVLGAQRAILTAWCRLIHEDVDHTWPRTDTVMSMALHIESRMPELRKHEAAGELVAEVRDLVSRIVACIDYPEDRARIHVGPCPEIPEGVPCPGQLHLRLPYRNDGKRPRVECGACRSVWYAEQFHRLGYRIPIDPAAAQNLVRAISA